MRFFIVAVSFLAVCFFFFFFLCRFGSRRMMMRCRRDTTAYIKDLARLVTNPCHNKCTILVVQRVQSTCMY